MFNILSLQIMLRLNLMNFLVRGEQMNKTKSFFCDHCFCKVVADDNTCCQCGRSEKEYAISNYIDNYPQWNDGNKPFSYLSDVLLKEWVVTRMDICGNPSCDGCNANDANQTCWVGKEHVANISQIKLLEYLIREKDNIMSTGHHIIVTEDVELMIAQLKGEK
jgi:hypothetical protein